MKKILNMLKIDYRLITRNPILLFMVIAPALLSFAFLAVLGNAGQGTLQLVLSESIPEEVAANLEKVSDIEFLEDEVKIKQRVEKFDSVAGIIYKDNSYKILFEGNEGETFANKVRLLVAHAAANDLPVFSSLKVESKGNIIIELAAVSLLLTALFMSSVVSGFNIISERESRAIRAIAVSPIGMERFIGARTLMATLLGLGNIALCVLIMGRRTELTAFLVSALCSVSTIALIALGLGCTAKNQIGAIASIKIIMPACLALPLSGYFVPEQFKPLYYGLPNYWQFESLRSAWNGSFNWIANIAMFITGFIWVAVLNKFFRAKLGIKLRR